MVPRQEQHVRWDNCRGATSTTIHNAYKMGLRGILGGETASETACASTAAASAGNFDFFVLRETK